MKPERKRLAYLLGALVVAAALRLLWSDGVPVRPGADRSGAARRAGRAAADRQLVDVEVPKIVRPVGPDAASRNIFRFYDRPTPTPTRVPPTPTPLPAVAGPDPMTPTPTPTQIVAPVIPFQVVGVFGPPDDLIVTLEHAGKLVSARKGDTVENQFVLLKVNLQSVDFGFVGLPASITKRVPISKDAK